MNTELARLREHVLRQPQDFVARLMLADAEMETGEVTAADATVRHALALHPGHPEALARLGRLMWMQGRLEEAIRALGQAAAIVPQHPGIALWLGHALEDGGREEAAAEAYAHALALAPDEPYFASQLLNMRRRLCDWRDVDALSARLRRALAAGQPVIEPFAFLSEDAAPAEQLVCARLRARAIASHVRPMPPPGPRTPGPLRLGFLSNGFGAHPTGLLTVSLFEALARHDRRAHLFALNPDDGSTIRRRLQAATDMRDVSGVPHHAIAPAIRAADIDVLFDLRGWGGGGAPEVLAMRPARLQVNWLAYPGTSGAPWIDAVLADDFVLPAPLAPHFSERAIRLPRAFQPSDNTRVTGNPPARADCGLPASATVFCCFNNSYKLNPRSMGRMFAILRGVPESVLWLLSGPGRADQRLRDAAQAAGIAPARLVFARRRDHADYLALYRHADLFLDTSPYNAHTTASDALWAGCPVLTVPGTTFASRVAGSLNHHLGLDEMNAADDAGFIGHAIALARDPGALIALRRRVDERRRLSTVFDMDGFAADMLAVIEREAAIAGIGTA